VFNARRSIFCCRVFNSIDKAIELSANTPVAMVSPVTIYEQVNTTVPNDDDCNMTVAEMRKILEVKQVSFEDTALIKKQSDEII
jgi:hypothetical protein